MPPKALAATATNSLVEYYEQLRRRVVSGAFPGPRHGLALLLHKGMATWMQECVSCCVALEASTPESSTGIDQAIVGPLLESLRTRDKWKIMVAPDHPTPVDRRIHTATPPPFCMAGHAVQTVLSQPFSERVARDSDLQIAPGYDLMEYFLH